ncbi:MAG: orc1/cdc6 family replication initiation protein [Nanoarchaeota archaeon]|nr:orc1/cdc6 family replication initiation protein [Nanoarchaeota archaeon]MBU1705067.1 orc1/cdc6 family replication initiation protein [Nanoarchaeota archaeon]
MDGGLNNFFEAYLKKDPLIKNKSYLQSGYMPDLINHRISELEKVANILAPALRVDKPSNLFIFGKTGTGKTLVVKHTINQLSKFANEKNIKLKTIYLNCKLKKVADTEYRLIAQLLRTLGHEIPYTGLPTEEVYKKFYEVIDNEKQIILVALDEVDQLVTKIGDELLYNLTRINEELKMAKIAFVGISNDLFFIDTLDPRVRSSLSEEEVVFPPYNAIQIKDILKQRCDLAFADAAIEPGVIEKCAAYAAREHGDARRAIELLRVAAEIAERKCQDQVKIENIDDAEKKIEYDRILDLIGNQPKQSQLVLYSIILMQKEKQEGIFTGEVYELYQKLCPKIGLSMLTQRRVSDIIAEMDMLGIINSRVLSKGRYGRSREITITLPGGTLEKVVNLLSEGLGTS